ncbi:PF11845 family protein [Leptospira borgpetersenii str. Noumea 25]|nr:PF11845 family protein [Leptospira borgpetersenii str. Noumea 25]
MDLKQRRILKFFSIVKEKIRMDFMNAFFKFSQKQFRVLSSYKNNPVKLLSFLLFIQFFAVCDSGRNSEKKEILLRLISEFQIDLQKNLESAIRTKGIVGAINVCRTISPKKEADLKAEFPGVLIRRVSEKPRNPSHRPEIWETEIFNQWKESQKTGMAPYTIVLSKDKEVRILQPIILQNATCLQCHGGPQDINPAVSKKIAELYPNDQAKGYKLGELRGAFSATW